MERVNPTAQSHTSKSKLQLQEDQIKRLIVKYYKCMTFLLIIILLKANERLIFPLKFMSNIPLLPIIVMKLYCTRRLALKLKKKLLHLCCKRSKQIFYCLRIWLQNKSFGFSKPNYPAILYPYLSRVISDNSI